MARVAIVTGGNKGVGFATCRGLSKKFNGDVYLTARSSERGMAAVAELIKEGCTVHFHQLDIDEPSSIEKIRDFMREKYGGIDVLINNAAINFKNNATEPMGLKAELNCKTNYWSTKNVCDLLFPALKPGARVVNVSSSSGKLSTISDSDLKKKLASSGFGLTVGELDDIMKNFDMSAKDGTYAEKGYKGSTYAMSKVGLSALTRIQQQEFNKDTDSDLVINHVHPGYVDTDMTSHKGPRTIDEGACSSIYAALLPPHTKCKGKYIWEDCSEQDWVTY